MKVANYVFMLLLCSMGASQATPAVVDINIKAQAMRDALDALAVQTGIQLIYHDEAIRASELTAPAVSGSMTPEAALQKLFSKSDLQYTFIDERTVAIERAPKVGAMQPLTRTGAQVVPVASLHVASDDQKLGEDQKESSSGVASSKVEKNKISEIIVTAQKRRERLIDVPISVVVMGAEELEKRRVISIDDLQSTVPGLSLDSNGAERSLFLRGIANNNGGNLPLIGLYLDEADVTAGPFSQLDVGAYDLERVEVLRGPQGTLYGGGSAGGAVRFITQNPVLDRFSFDSDIAAMFTEHGEPSQQVSGAINIPLIDNELGLRISGSFGHLGGWVDQPAAERKDWNDQNRSEVRVKGLWQPSTEFTVSAMSLLHRNDLGINIGEDEFGNYTQKFNLTTTPTEQDDFDIHNLTLTYDLPTFRVLSATSYFDQDQERKNYGFVIPSFGGEDIQSPVIIQAWALTQELRLTSIGSGQFQWTLGGFYRHYRSALSNTFYFGAPGTPLPAPGFLKYRTASKAGSVYGDINYRLASALTVGAGVRYFQDDQERFDFAPVQTTQSGEFHSVDPRIYARYQLSDHINVYASAAKGFRSGGFNTLNVPAYDPEDVRTYELGTKMALLDGRLSATAAVFYSKYAEYQIVALLPPPAPPVGVTSNAGTARIRGIEADVTWHPTTEWTFGISGTYLDAEFIEIENPDPANTPYVVGDPVDYTPKYMVTTSAQRDFLWSGRPVFARVDYSQKDRTFSRHRAYGFFGESDVINTLNFNAGMQFSDMLSLNVFGQNLLNDRGFTGPESFLEYAARTRPRTYGVGFSLSFE